MVAVAHRGLGHLGQQGLGIAQKDMQHLPVTFEFLLEPHARQPVRGAGALHDRTVGGGFTAHEQRHANRAIVPHDRDFRGGAVFQHVQERDDRVGWKIDVPQRVAGLVQNHAEWHRNELQVWKQPLPLLRRQGSQNLVFLGVSRGRH